MKPDDKTIDIKAWEAVQEVTKDAAELRTKEINSIEELFEFTLKREIPEEIAIYQDYANRFDTDLKRYRKNIEQKQQEIKLLEAKIIKYEGIKKMWIKETEQARKKLEVYKKFHETLISAITKEQQCN